jgi:S-disulfanyl-L-cysteine oxidoreductase SoxD
MFRTPFLKRHVIALSAAAVWVCALHITTSSGQGAAGQASVNAGVYTAAQADRGAEIFKSQCTTCHDNARFTGEDFIGTWSGKPLYELYDIVHTTMPEDNPGGLKPQQYADVIAFFLRLNGYPAGQNELKGTDEAMRAIKFERRGK